MKPVRTPSRSGHRYLHLRVRRGKPGTAPGTLTPESGGAGPDTGSATRARLHFLRYGKEGAVEEKSDVDSADPLLATHANDRILWLHFQGTPSAEQLAWLGARHNLHPLALEDVYRHEARPKSETYEAHQFVVLDLVQRHAAGDLSVDPVCFFLGDGFVISISTGADTPDLFEPVRQRLRNLGKIRAWGADYLLYALMDVVVDSSFALLEAMGDELETLENDVLTNPTQAARNHIHAMKRELVAMRRAWWPQREVIAALMRNDNLLITDHTRLYLRDCHEHSVIVMDFVETYREMASSLLDTYLSAVSQRMNDIMKTLTLIATIFLPLTFIVGLYGMNFDTASRWNMPELHWEFGYFYALGLMLLVSLGMAFYFRRRHWL